MMNFTLELREHKLKATPQRLAIADILYAKGHVNIDSLYEAMSKKFNTISLATIYKNINLMLQAAFIEEVKIPHEKSVYELKKSAHSHLVCNNCSSVEDVNIDLKDISFSTITESGFKIESSSVIFSGKCSSCN